MNRTNLLFYIFLNFIRSIQEQNITVVNNKNISYFLMIFKVESLLFFFKKIIFINKYEKSFKNETNIDSKDDK